MKRFTLMMLTALLAIAAGAQPRAARQLAAAADLTKQQQASRPVFDRQQRDARPLAKAPRQNSPELVTPPADLVTKTYRMNGSIQLSGWETLNRKIQIGFDGSDVYVQGFIYYLPEAWVKGTLNEEGTQVTFPVQFVGNIEVNSSEGPVTRDLYFWPATYGTGDDGKAAWLPYEAVFNYREDVGTFVLQQDVVTYIFENTLPDALRYVAVYDSDLTIADDSDTVEVPEGLETETYQMDGIMMGYDYDAEEWYENEPFARSVNVGFDDTHIYVQGLCPELPEAWAVGNRQGDTFVFANGQYFGTYIYNFEGYPIYLVGFDAEADEAADIVMELDEETGTLTTGQWVSMSAIADAVLAYELYSGVSLSHVEDVATVPATPGFGYFEYEEEDELVLIELDVPATDVEGRPLITSKLYYQLFTDYGEGKEPLVLEADLNESLPEDMSVIPYDYNDDDAILRGGEMMFFFANLDGLKRIGVQSIYEGGGEVNKSEVSWYLVDEDYVPGDEEQEEGPVTLPEGLEPEMYSMTAVSIYWGEDDPEDYSADVQVAIDAEKGNVYIQGLSSWLPEAWVKGRLSGTTVSVAAQYLGEFAGWGIPIDVVFNGATFVYDAQAGMLTSEEGYTSTATYEMYGETGEETADAYINVVITKVPEVAATPAAPEIVNFHLVQGYGYELNLNIPLEDVDGNPIFRSKLSYQLFYRQDGQDIPITLEADKYEYATEDLTIIPYLYTDHWEVTEGGETVFIYLDGIEDWDAVGAKSIYTAAGETRESTITWKTNDWGTRTGIDSMEAQEQAVYFDLQGRQTAAQAKGLVLKQTRRADGSVKTVKVVR